MSVLITMAGLGSRFQRAGYTVPKYAVEVHGRTLFEWSMLSLERLRGSMSFIFVVRAEQNAASFISNHAQKLGIALYSIFELDELTDGQATTAYRALGLCDPDEPLLIYNIDTFVEPDFVEPPDTGLDGYIPCFKAPGEHWSFVRLDECGIAAEVREKQRISDNATIGLYWFRSVAIFRNFYEKRYVQQYLLSKNEAYIAPLYNDMIENGLKVGISLVPPERVHVLGTPEEVQAFAASPSAC